MKDDLCSKFSVNTFVQTVNAALDPCAANQRQAEQSLVSFKAAPNSWLHINSILTETDDKKAHFIAMQLLEHTVKTRWNIFTDEHKESFKNYIIQQILLRSKETHKSEILEKFNIILVEILKRDWPRKWPSFIVDIINASQTSGMDVCTNSLLILKRLNDEIFIFTDVTTVRKRMLEAQLKQEFVHIFKLINNILEWSKTSETSKNLLNATFDTFESYCDLIPVNFLCETNIIENIFFYINRGYAVNVMKCLIKIVNKANELENDTSFASSSYKGVFDQKVFILHNELILFLVKTYNEYANAQLRDVYAIMNWEEKEFVTMTVTLLCAFYVNYKKYESENLANVKSGMRLITKISYVDDENIFYEIIGFWKAFAESIYIEYSTIMKSKNYGTPTSITTRDKYKSILKGMIEASINKMPRPEEVYVTENEYGEIVKEKITETKEIEHYQNVKTTFFYLSYLNRDFTLELIKSKTNSLFEAEKFSYDFLNRISWSAGCMAGALDEKIESDFFVYILKELLSLCESRYTKDDKAVIASNIMFLIGSFDRFLLANHRFLKTVVKKLFEFMDETHEGIKDMACDTFLKISQKCSKIFATQMECDESYIVYIVKNLPSATSTLEFYQKRIVYEALCIMFTSLSERELLPHTNMLIKCFEWDITQHATKDQLNACCHYLRSYEIVFTNLPSIINYSSPFFMSIFENFARNISENSKYAKLVNDEIVRLMISVAKQSSKTNVDINLINNIYSRILSCFSAVQDSMYLILASEIVENFKTNDVQSRDAFMVNNLLVNITTMDQNNTELLSGYLTLILSLVNNSFDSSFAYMFNNIDFFDKVFSNIILGLTVDQSTNDLSLRILDNLVTNTFERRLYMFYQRYALQIIENIIGIIVDKDQSYSFDLQCQVLAKTISNIKSNNMIRLSDTADNTNYASGYIYNILGSAFRNLTKESMELFIVGLFTMSSNCDILKEHVSDFKIKIYEYYSNEELNDEIALKEEREKRL